MRFRLVEAVAKLIEFRTFRVFTEGGQYLSRASSLRLQQQPTPDPLLPYVRHHDLPELPDLIQQVRLSPPVRHRHHPSNSILGHQTILHQDPATKLDLRIQSHDHHHLLLVQPLLVNRNRPRSPNVRLLRQSRHYRLLYLCPCHISPVCRSAL